MKTLETTRLILRDWTNEDLGCGIHTDEIIKYLIEAKNNYAVVLKETGVVIGTIGLNEDADDNPNRRNVGVRIAEQYRNIGLMSEALTEVFASNKGKEFSWFCKVDDERSRHLAEKFGFEYIKTFPKVQRNEKEVPTDYFYYVLKL